MKLDLLTSSLTKVDSSGRLMGGCKQYSGFRKSALGDTFGELDEESESMSSSFRLIDS